MSGTIASTEAADVTTADIDRVSTAARVHLLLDAQLAAVDAVHDARANIARAVDTVVAALQAGGRVVVLGAGTSGRLAVLDASELPPTFGFDPARWEGRIAGGDAALRRSIEGAEDDEAAGALVLADLARGDVAIGVSASGGAPYVRAAIVAARARGVRTIAVVNVRESALAAAAEIAIEAVTGAEPIAGSTRMRAGTAQKIVLNTISTAAMIALGKTYRNLMVDVAPTNAKLRARAERLVRDLAGDGADAAALLAAAGGDVKTAVVMARRAVARDEAARLLAAADGRLATVIDDA